MTMKTMRWVWSAMVFAAAACGGGSGDDDTPPPPDGLTVVATIPATPNRALDLLLVIDDAGPVVKEQGSLASALPRSIQVLNQLPGGLPDLHVGVVTTNVGSGGVAVSGCSTPTEPDGDDGLLQTSGCTALQGPYLSDVKNPDGSRLRNYSGDLDASLRCMVQRGISGCGFEQPLEAMKRALSPGHNPGFLRPDAVLGVLILSEDDDCSTLPGGSMFADPNGTITSPLGPRTTFRCFEFGVQCDDDATPRMFGTKTGCVPRVDSPHMPTAQPYIDFLRGLKASPSAIVVGTITGPVDELRSAVVGPDVSEPSWPVVEGSCAGGNGNHQPGLRLRSFLDGFPDRSVEASICEIDQNPTMEDFATRLLGALGSPCITQPLADIDAATPGLQPRCVVTQYTLTTGTRTDPVVIPACTVDGTLPCWQLDATLTECSFSSSDQGIVITRDGAAPAGTEIEARCQVEAP